ncbi:hypothetical protein [Azotobacter salinestris]|uniref:hypothetical protein n=1 Tax=Azotobacter salinestris TaxID=69964 RepID=UPI001266D828|nr:hypothetical protein [Azotobacter salinestris]
MMDPEAPIEIPADTEGEIPRSRDEQGERESEEVKEVRRKSGSLNARRVRGSPDESGVEDVPGYDIELPPDANDEIKGLPSDIDPDSADIDGQINPL